MSINDELTVASVEPNVDDVEPLPPPELLIDSEEAKLVGHAARTPARNFGIVITTVVPAPGVDSNSSP